MKGIKGAGDSLKALARKIYSKVVGQGASVLNVSPHTQLTGNNVLQNWGSTTKWPFIPRRQHQITPRRSSTISLAGQLNLQDDEYDQQPDHPISDAVASMIQDGVLEISSTSASTLRLKGDEAPTNSEEKAVSAGHISATSNAALSTASADYDQRLQEQKETEAFIQEFLDPMAHFHETLEDEVAEAEAARLKKQDAHQLWLTESRHLPISGKRRKKPLVPKSKQSVLPSSKSSSPHHHFNRPSLPLLQFSPITDQHQLFLSIMANTSPAADSSTSLHPSSPPPLSAASSSFTSSPSVCSLHSRSCLSHTSALVPSPNECCLPTFGLFALSYQWIRGVKAASRDTKKEKYERIRKEDELRREWTIHGLWPNKCDGSVPNPRYECDGRTGSIYDEEYITHAIKQDHQLYENLKLYWPSQYEEYTDERFWAHEWKTHGLCVSTFNQQCYPDEWKQGDDIRSYFATTVYTFKQFDVQAALTNQGITPSDSTPTSIAQLNKALELEWTAMKDERAGEDDMSEKGGHHQHLQKRSPRGGSKKDWWGRWKYKDDGGEFERNPGFRVQWWCTERSSSYSSSVDHKGSSDFNTTVSTNALSHEATTIRKSYWLTDAVVNLHATPGLHVADGTYANIDGEEDGDGHHHRRVLKLDLAPSKDQRPRTIEGCDAGPDDDIYIKE